MTTTTPPTGDTPPLTDEELADIREWVASTDAGFPPGWKQPDACVHRKRLLAEVDRLQGKLRDADKLLDLMRGTEGRLRAELAESETRRKELFRRLGEHMDDLGDAHTENTALVDQFRSFPTDPGPGDWSTSYRMGYAHAGRDVRAIAAALGETGGSDA